VPEKYFFYLEFEERGMASRGRITIELDKDTKSQLQAVLKDKLAKISSYTDDVLPVRRFIYICFLSCGAAPWLTREIVGVT
jgi:hypothetical protein